MNFKKDWVYIASLILIPILFVVFFIGWPKGLGALHFAQASVVLLVAYGVSLMRKLSKFWIIIVLSLLLVQLTISLLFGYYYSVLGWFWAVKPILLVASSLAFLTIPVYLYLLNMGIINKITFNKK